MKLILATLTTCLFLSAQAFATGAETTNVIGVLPVNKQRLSKEDQSYEQLVQQRFLEGIDAIARSPMISSKKENVGLDIYKENIYSISIHYF
jgi:hypothetical protein